MPTPQSPIETASLLRFLDRLESTEAELLGWGLIDIGSSEDELLDGISDFLLGEVEAVGVHAEDFLDALVEAGLVIELRYSHATVYRSRMAESVRLLGQLRQLFERGPTGAAWRVAPRLVADFRLAVRRRRFPKRNAPIDDVLDELDKVAGDVQLAAVRELLTAEDGRTLDLARFQVRSTRTVLANFQTGEPRGVVVTAGTGSGKTLAFYLPVLAHVQGLSSRKPWTKVLAVYPRNELLKDQFTEAYRQIRTLNRRDLSDDRRPIRIGTYFGQTPHDLPAVRRKWRLNPGVGRVCPFLRCPEATCGGEMVWREEDLDCSVHRLECADCGNSVDDSEVALTRRQIESAPPDLVFTSTEMLNQRSSDRSVCHVFGIGPRVVSRPVAVLLDEIHTYTGTHGAHVAYLVRRLREALDDPQIVGLSATLRDAGGFFAQLTGLRIGDVAHIEPLPNEMTEEGMEYLVAVRSDPSSRVSVLSTTIQTAMLMRRVLDKDPISRGAYGTRVFAFTDDLDVTNRLFHYLRDAEGYDYSGRPTNHPSRTFGSLANLRASVLNERTYRLAAGQSWDMVEELGHTLKPASRIKIGRTSSQDTGVQSDADVVVATASLEVGYDDPTVGVVIQHKAPRGEAQFLQRIGRAGRPRSMRPFAIVVLSDYGRDRIAYQSYERLFDPELPSRNLPLSNRYVLKIQCIFATFEWLSARVVEKRGSVWTDIANDPWADRERQRHLADAIRGTLASAQELRQLRSHLVKSLRIPIEEADAIMWEAPRGLVTEALPTALRRLDSAWGVAYPSAHVHHDVMAPNHPLPDFAPRALFEELAIPDVQITLPSQRFRTADDPQYLPVAQAIREFAPGRVTRRYAISYGGTRHWVDPQPKPDSDEAGLELEEFVSEWVFVAEIAEGSGCTHVFQPIEFAPAEVEDRSVLDSSNARPIWRTHLERPDSGDELDVPEPSPWTEVISGLAFHTHNDASPLSITRYSVGSEGEIRYDSGRTDQVLATFTQSGHPAALGFRVVADGIVIGCELRAPDAYGFDPAHVRALRSARFHESVVKELGRAVGPFQAERIGQLYQTVLVFQAVRHEQSILEAHEQMTQQSLPLLVEEALSIAIASGSDPIEDPAEVSSTTEERRSRLHEELVSLFSSDTVFAALQRTAPSLWEDPDTGWGDWINQRFCSTLGAAVIEAAERLDPQIDGESLVCDVRHGDIGTAEIWISETASGGLGTIEAMRRGYSEDPRRFFQLVESALGPSDFELVDSELPAVLATILENERIADLADQIRLANSLSGTSTALYSLIGGLAAKGVFTCHPVIAAVATRVLRPGLNRKTDRLLKTLHDEWVGYERKLGLEIDLVTIASLLESSDVVVELLPPTGVASPSDRRAWRVAALTGLLWPRGWRVVAQGLSHYNPFVSPTPTDRRLLTALSSFDVQPIDLDDRGWFEAVHRELVARGSVALTTDASRNVELKRAIASLVTTPVEVLFMQFYPRIAGVRRSSRQLIVTLDLKHALQ